MSEAERAERAALMTAIMEQRHPNWHELTKAEQRALRIKATEEACEELVAEGTLRVAGTNDRGQRIYGLVDQPKKH